MAHGYLFKFLSGKAKIYSAGVETHGVNQNAIESMGRDGVDISNYSSNNVNEYRDINFDFVITVCDHARESCPIVPIQTAIKIHKNFKDPSKIINSKNVQNDYDICRDEIKKLIVEIKNRYF
tara:strand:- start:1101 stop:1466 length:366 start_codon:yes stop_codon:yes gene_type:complete